jgi:hypothetical protein
LGSSADRPELKALAELEAVIGHVTEELATWRRRALRAESRQPELGMGPDLVSTRERILELEAENADLSARLGAARERLEHLLNRLQFLEDQVGTEEQTR